MSDAAGIEIVRSVRDDGERGWSYTVAHEAEVRAALGDPRQIADRRALASVRGVLLAAAPESERPALGRTLGGIGDEPRLPKVAGGAKLPSTVDALLAAHGDARRVVEMAALVHDGGILPGCGLTRPQMATLRAAAKGGGAGILRALALAGVRDDVPLDVAALLGPETGRKVESDGEEMVERRGPDAGGRAGVAGEPPSPGSDRGAGADGDRNPGELRRVRGSDVDRGAVEAAPGGVAPPARAVQHRPAPAVRDPLLVMSEHVDRSFAAGACPLCGGLLAPGGCERIGPELICRGGAPPTTTAPSATTTEETRAMSTTVPTDYREPDTEQPYDEPRCAAPLAVRAPEQQRALAAPRREEAPAPPAKPEPPAMMSESTSELWSALFAAQATFEEVVKTRAMVVRGEVRYHYANLSDIVNAVMPSLKREGFVCSHICRGNRLHVRLVHVPSSQWIEGVLPFVPPTVNGPDGVQALGSLLTYLRRYLLSMLLGVVAVDDDDDGNAAQTAGRGRAA